MNKELHLILLWQNARYKQQEILDDIQKNLTISECIEIEWSKNNVASNFTRFYGVKLPSRSSKEKECGKGKFLLVTVWDENPKYEYVETSRGVEKVNTNIFYLKDRYRSWTRGGHKVHSTNTVAETNHDITLLLGKNYEDYTSAAPAKWDGNIRSIKRDITGCDGWNNLEEFFYTLNATINYCVLRNYEILPAEFKSDLHGDIDLLTDNYDDMVFLTNAKPVFRKKYRVHHKVKIAGQDVLFDFRFLGDNYYCLEFEENILYNRVLNDKNIFIPNSENALYSLIYHCLIHKKRIASDYYQKVRNLLDNSNLKDKHDIDKYKYPFDYYYKILNKFMYSNNYQFTRPIDLSVYYNKKCLNMKNIMKWLSAGYGMKDLNPYMLGILCTTSGYQFYTGIFNGKKLFIKWGGYNDSVKYEYRFGKIIYELDNTHFIKPVLFNYNNGKNFVAMEFADGTMLSDLIKEKSITEEQKVSFVKQLEQIACTLEESGVMHRDIRPENVLVTPDGTLKLIDLQFATYSKVSLFKYSTLKSLYRLSWSDLFSIKKIVVGIYQLGVLGAKYRCKFLRWDDMVSINKIVKAIGGESKLIEGKIGNNVLSIRYLLLLFLIIAAPVYVYSKLRKK